jgi:hypothetical protein
LSLLLPRRGVPLAAADRGALAARPRQVGVTVAYDPAYTRIPYPGGDVPLRRGVCTDVVVRAFRASGIDLQVKLHEDMRATSPLSAPVGPVAARSQHRPPARAQPAALVRAPAPSLPVTAMPPTTVPATW